MPTHKKKVVILHSLPIVFIHQSIIFSLQSHMAVKHSDQKKKLEKASIEASKKSEVQM